MAVANETNYKPFYSLANGVRVNDAVIDSWVREGLRHVRGGKPHYSASTGDSSVVVLKHDSCIDVIVSTSAGFSRVSLYHDHDEPSCFIRELAKKGGPVK